MATRFAGRRSCSGAASGPCRSGNPPDADAPKSPRQTADPRRRIGPLGLLGSGGR